MDEFILFFKLPCMWIIASAARTWITSIPQRAATTFALSSIFMRYCVHIFRSYYNLAFSTSSKSNFLCHKRRWHSKSTIQNDNARKQRRQRPRDRKRQWPWKLSLLCQIIKRRIQKIQKICVFGRAQCTMHTHGKVF